MKSTLDPAKVNVGQASLAALAPHIESVMRKLETGVYPTEATTCFCGSLHSGHTITERDRYMIPHRMVLCPDCSLIRANPRMTTAAYKEFYNTEYRPLYDTWSFGEDPIARFDMAIFQKTAIEQGSGFMNFLEYFNIKPKVVVDIGSNLGGMLQPLKEHGVKCYGVEVYEHGLEFSTAQGIPTFRTIEEVVAAGVKADVIIMHDVVEHLSDLNDIKKVIPLLAPDGYFYTYTPGLFNKQLKLNKVWQNAHTYQFISATLNYVMESLGFEACYRDEEIVALWQYRGNSAERLVRPTEWITYIKEHLEQKPKRRLPPIHCINKFDVETQQSNACEVLALGLPSLEDQICAHHGVAMVVAGGPSVNGEIETIRRMQAEGVKLFVIERMYPWCHIHDIHPDYVVVLDSSEDVEEGFTHLQPGVTYLLSTSAYHKSVKRLKESGATCYIFSNLNPYLKIQELWYKYGYKDITVLASGGSVALSSLTLAMTLGFDDVHLFGVDLKITKKGLDYAEGIAGKGVPRDYSLIYVTDRDTGKEKEIMTCLPFISFTQQFFRLAETGRQVGLLKAVTVHGDSLINDMWDGKWIEPDKPLEELDNGKRDIG